MAVKPSEPVATHSLQVTTVHQLSAKMIEVELDAILHARSEHQFRA